jgi:hypothetical protein
MSFFRVCKTYHEYACDPCFDLLTASSLAAVAPLIRGTVQQTFAALRLREGMAPYLEFILKSYNFDKLIAEEADKFIENPYVDFYDRAFHKALGTNDLHSPMKIIFENDNVLRYMIGNINFGMPMLLDVTEVTF